MVLLHPLDDPDVGKPQSSAPFKYQPDLLSVVCARRWCVFCLLRWGSLLLSYGCLARRKQGSDKSQNQATANCTTQHAVTMPFLCDSPVFAGRFTCCSGFFGK